MNTMEPIKIIPKVLYKCYNTDKCTSSNVKLKKEQPEFMKRRALALQEHTKRIQRHLNANKKS